MHLIYTIWPYSTCSHHIDDCTECIAQTDDYGHTCINPQNIPHARHIESFWGTLGQKDFANDWETKKYEQLIDSIKFKLKVFDAYHLQTLMRHATPQKNSRRGVNTAYKK